MSRNENNNRAAQRIFAVAAVFLILILTGGFSMPRAADECVATGAKEPPKGVIVLKSPYKAKQGPVPFNHGGHVNAGIACTECHHVYENGKNVWHKGDVVQPCCACHKEKNEGKVLSLENAYHKNCRDCHRALHKEGKPSGPYIKCTDCHKKGA